MSRPSRLGLVAGLLAGVTIALAALTFVHDGPLHALDRDTALDLNRYIRGHPALLQAWRWPSRVGVSVTWWVLAAVAALVLWVRGLRATAVAVVVAVLGADLLQDVLKPLVGRHRPVLPHPVAHAAGQSFPSGHALMSFVALGLVVILAGPHLRRSWRAVLTLVAGVLVVIIGLSRLILGVHYVTDVLGGWLVGALWLIAVWAAMRRLAAPPQTSTGAGAVSRAE